MDEKGTPSVNPDATDSNQTHTRWRVLERGSARLSSSSNSRERSTVSQTEHWNCFNKRRRSGKTSQRRGGAHMSFPERKRYHFKPNWLELIEITDVPFGVCRMRWSEVKRHGYWLPNIYGLVEFHLSLTSEETTVGTPCSSVALFFCVSNFFFKGDLIVPATALGVWEIALEVCDLKREFYV